MLPRFARLRVSFGIGTNGTSDHADTFRYSIPGAGAVSFLAVVPAALLGRASRTVARKTERARWAPLRRRLA
jgi:hypothetical protein